MEPRTLIGLIVCLCAVSLVQSQVFRNRGNGFGSQRGFNRGNRQQLARNNRLNAGQRGGLGLQVGNNRLAQRDRNQRARLGNQLASQRALNARNNLNAQTFNNLDVAHNVQQADRTALTYENENFYNEGTKFSQNSGTALSTGNEVQAFDNLQQNNLLDAAFVDNSAFAQNNQLGLLGQQQNSLGFNNNLLAGNTGFANGVNRFGVNSFGTAGFQQPGFFGKRR